MFVTDKHGVGRSIVVCVVACLGLFGKGMPSGYGKTALEYLREAPQPHFRQGHSLLPLSRWGWSMPFEVRVELCECWGYALEFGLYATAESVKALDNPNSDESRICALTAKDSNRYPLAVLTERIFYSSEFTKTLPPETWTRDAHGRLVKDQSGKEIQIWSPEAPTDVFVKGGELSAAPLKRIHQRCPIALVINGGEYATSVYGHHAKYWSQDPEVMRAKGERNWYEYLSQSKTRQEKLVSEAFRRAAPDRKLYIFYYTDGSPHRLSNDGWWQWAWDYKRFRGISDLPNSSLYYLDFNTGWTGRTDMLTCALSSIAQQLAEGDALSYNWVCAGYKEGKFADLERYMGFLKCYYTAGQIGAVAGYFSFPQGGFVGNLGPDPPHWLRQMMVLGHAHALFSHLEDFLRSGDLLPGPNRHRWSTDLPAYEFPTGDADARVVVRKHRLRQEWLITAWAAGGPEREARVEISRLGKVTLLARPCGSVYRVVLKAGRPVLLLLDRNGMAPSAGF
jgi:hypothetical protein